MQMQKYVPMKQNVMNLKSYEDKELIRRERRDGGEGEERGNRERIEIERKETKGN